MTIPGAARLALLAGATPWLMPAAPSESHPQTASELASCRAEKTALKAGMAAVFRDFDAPPSPLPLDVLVSLDGRIRDLLRNRPRYRPCIWERPSIHDQRWERMGVAPGHGTDLEYTGRLLVTAHRRAPRSPLRSYTLFATVFGEVPAGRLSVMPNIKAAYAYEAEFPHGPFIRDVYRTIADFHKDLFMVLRDRLNDFKYDCFAPHISQRAWPVQESRAKAISVDYYQRILQLAPGDDDARTFLRDTRAGTVREWSFCAD